MGIRLPRLMDKTLKEKARLDPVDVSIDLNLSPLSTAEMELSGREDVQVGDFAELYTRAGSAGIYRVVYVDRTYGGGINVSLEHGLTTLSDAMLAGEGKKTTGKPKDILKQLLDCQTTVMWQLGDVEADEDLTWEYDNTNALEGLTNVLEQLPDYALDFDQTTSPWTLHLRKLAEDDACECRLNRNLENAQITTDYAELCTVLHVPGLDDPLEADTIGQWGRVVRHMDADEKIGEELLRKAGNAYLEERKNPRVTIKLDAVDLCRITGESFDRFHLGRICRVCLPDYKDVLRHRVVTLSYPAVYSQPDRVKVTLAHASTNASTAIAGLIVDTTVTRKRITRDLRAQGDLIIAAEKTLKLYGEQIEAMAKEITLKADLILLEGYVKATELEAELARFDSLLTGAATIDALMVDAIRCNNHLVAQGALTVNGNFNLHGTTVDLVEADVVTGVSGHDVTGEYKTIQYLNWDGTKASMSVCTGISQSAYSLSKGKINYVGTAMT